MIFPLLQVIVTLDKVFSPEEVAYPLSALRSLETPPCTPWSGCGAAQWSVPCRALTVWLMGREGQTSSVVTHLHSWTPAMMTVLYRLVDHITRLCFNNYYFTQIKYQACPDIEGSESKGRSGLLYNSLISFQLFTVERMTCVAKWKEGNKRYFVALVTSRQSKWVEQKDRYQCFLYEDISNKMKMAQGQFTSSCQGLWSVLEGSRTFSLQKCRTFYYLSRPLILLILVAKPESCTLPYFLIKNPRWKSMNHNLSLHLDDGNTSFSFMKSGTMLEQVSCHSSQIDTSLKRARLITHVKSGW